MDRIAILPKSRPQPRASLLAIVAGLLGLALAGCTPQQIVIDLAPTSDRLDQTVVVSDGQWFGANRVALIDVSGLIVNSGQPRLIGAGPHPVSLLHEQLEAAANDRSVKAIILRLNTPGGTVTASDAMYREVQRFKQRTDKPVIALMMDTATSGGYYVACAADRIVTYPTSVTGSIGVIVQTFSFKHAMTRLGIQSDAITSGENKDAGSYFSTLTPEHREILQGLVDDYFDRFVDVVRTHRPGIAEEDFDKVTDGRVVSGERAVALGLADRTGDVYDAFEEAKTMANIERADLVRYHRPRSAVGSPYARAPQPQSSSTATQVNLLQLNIDHLPGLDGPAGIYYLWRPDVQ